MKVIFSCYDFTELLVGWIYAIFWHIHSNDGKGAKFDTNETDIIQINNRTGGILKLSYFCQNFSMPISHQSF